MLIKMYKVRTKDGKSYPHLFDTIKEAIKTVGATKIEKVEEIVRKEEVSETSIDKKNIAVVSRRNNQEVSVSNTSYVCATYNRPVLTKIFEGMTLLELGEDTVLESKIHSMGTFDSKLHKEYKADSLDGREYQWAIYHLSGKTLTLEEATKKYKELENLNAKEGILTYIRK